jgi:hypothetical protein
MSHPDEALIHAWLDGELDSAEAERVEELVRNDPAWAAAAAEARGLIAATSRIIASLDNVPANVTPAARGVSRRPARWWTLRVAAVLVVVVGSAVVLRRAGLSPAGGDVAGIAPVAQQPAQPALGASPRSAAGPAALARTTGAVTRGLSVTPSGLAEEAGRRDGLAAVRQAPSEPVRGAAQPARAQAAQVAGAEKAADEARGAGLAAPAAPPQAAARAAAAAVPAVDRPAPAAAVLAAPETPAGAPRLRSEAAKTAATAPSDCVEIREPADTSPVALRRVIRLPAPASADTLARFGYELAKDRSPTGLSVRGDSVLGVLADGRRFVAVRVACPRR